MISFTAYVFVRRLCLNYCLCPTKLQGRARLPSHRRCVSPTIHHSQFKMMITPNKIQVTGVCMIFPERWPHCFFKNYKTLNYFNVFPSFGASLLMLKHVLRPSIKQCLWGLWQNFFVLRSSASLNSDYEICAESKSHTWVYRPQWITFGKREY